MTSTYSLKFASPPSLWGIYPRILTARKPSLVPEGRVVPRIEARLSRLRFDVAHLRRYREVCGCGPGASELPLAYPHVLASSLHLAMLASERFPVALLGLVHVSNRIERFGTLDPQAGGELRCWLEGHVETPRGQEFVLHTEWLAAGGTLWRERCTFLARAKRSGQGAGKSAPRDAAGGGPESVTGAAPEAGAGSAAGALAGAGANASEGESDAAVTTASFRAPAGLGRSYGQVSGDINPIHLADVTARAFGFRGAIAHGMWSLARCAAEFDPALAAGAPCALDVQFRLPVFLPSWLQLQQGRRGAAIQFALRDAQGAKTHLAGSLSPIA